MCAHVVWQVIPSIYMYACKDVRVSLGSSVWISMAVSDLLQVHLAPHPVVTGRPLHCRLSEPVLPLRQSCRLRYRHSQLCVEGRKVGVCILSVPMGTSPRCALSLCLHVPCTIGVTHIPCDQWYIHVHVYSYSILALYICT